MNTILINARSFRPKLSCILDTMNEINAHIALVTETWFTHSNELDNVLTDMNEALGFICIREDRTSGMGGGVAIVYNKSEVDFTKIKLQTNYEIVAAIGRRTGQKRKIAAIAAYIPPDFDAENSDLMLEDITNVIGHIKRKYNAPYIVLGGDFNKRDIAQAVKIYPDIKQELTPPTRGLNTLDIILTNYQQYIHESGVTDPIFNLSGTETDHKTVYVNARISRVPVYKLEEYEYIKQTKEGDEKMCKYLRQIDWQTTIADGNVDDMVASLHAAFKKGMEQCYV